MALADGYGVVVGSLVKHWIDPPDSEGRWPHYHLEVATPAGKYECVINLKSRTQIRVMYRDFRRLANGPFASILSRSSGFHALASNPTSGALDLIRHAGLQNQPNCECTFWLQESGLNLIQLMRYYLERVSRVLVFGEPYTTGLGVHNVHMNQGDPVGSEFAGENAIWQDGGVLLEYAVPSARLAAFVTRFETQSLQTDSNGRPR